MIVKLQLSGHIAVLVVFVNIVQRNMLEATNVLLPSNFRQFRSCGDYW
jgi:hypothetical protein